MSEEPPFFEEASRRVEERLSTLLGEPVTISVHLSLDRRLIDDVIKIDSHMFREELRYDLWDLMSRSERRGFALLMVRRGKEPLAFFFGYEDPDLPGGYYGDTMASLAEGRGVGSSLFTLVHTYCFENGYSHFSCHTEEVDEKGRKLRDWYLAMGMDHVETTEEFGDLMRVKLTTEHVSWMYHRYILGEKQYKRAQA
ncbi:MAG: GNAT family N-acetyltransferase [Candidatus Bathyarchaeota archaeon]|nr:GNAT family N-acetyltransferase [Candidatus Bathyarchaeota archaeon]